MLPEAVLQVSPASWRKGASLAFIKIKRSMKVFNLARCQEGKAIFRKPCCKSRGGQLEKKTDLLLKDQTDPIGVNGEVSEKAIFGSRYCRVNSASEKKSVHCSKIKLIYNC
ncbi:hypothetical protein TNCV_3334781 [Trichonephila clavipes]|nr:hypothetical protein TNCV_3334781 [Trichonephila clavipes]